MSALEFQPWPKIARLNRDITITEKIDGTNAAVVIVPLSYISHVRHEGQDPIFYVNDAKKITTTIGEFAVLAQSRTRFITPQQDNYGFAKWVERNAEALVGILGAGTHFGEWWGSGIQRKYGLTGSDKRFSLFNTGRWNFKTLPHTNPFDRETFADRPFRGGVEGLDVVPVLYQGEFSEDRILESLEILRQNGSDAAPGFPRPEGIVVWHDAARTSFKVTLEGDEAPKGQEAHRYDEEIAA